MKQRKEFENFRYCGQFLFPTTGCYKKKRLPQKAVFFNDERETGFEPATSTLARLHSTTELFPQLRVKGVEPPRRKTLDPKSSASTSSATLASINHIDISALIFVK